MPLLLLQKPNCTSKTKEHINYLEKRLERWKEGDLTSLLSEGRAIQNRLSKSHSVRGKQKQQQQVSRLFANLMFQGKTQAALQLLSNKGKGSVLRLNDTVDDSTTVKDILKSKHPNGVAASPDSIINGTAQDTHPVIFDSIDSALMRSTSLKTRGAAGPSGLDAYAWRRLCT